MAWNQKELLSRLHWNSAGDSGGLASHSLAQQDCWGGGGLSCGAGRELLGAGGSIPQITSLNISQAQGNSLLG